MVAAASAVVVDAIAITVGVAVAAAVAGAGGAGACAGAVIAWGGPTINSCSNQALATLEIKLSRRVDQTVHEKLCPEVKVSQFSRTHSRILLKAEEDIQAGLNLPEEVLQTPMLPTCQFQAVSAACQGLQGMDAAATPTANLH